MTETTKRADPAVGDRGRRRAARPLLATLALIAIVVTVLLLLGSSGRHDSASSAAASGAEQAYPYTALGQGVAGPLLHHAIYGSACILAGPTELGDGHLLVAYTHYEKPPAWADGAWIALDPTKIGAGLRAGDVIDYHGTIEGTHGYRTPAGYDAVVPELRVTELSVTGSGCS